MLSRTVRENLSCTCTKDCESAIDALSLAANSILRDSHECATAWAGGWSRTDDKHRSTRPKEHRCANLVPSHVRSSEFGRSTLGVAIDSMRSLTLPFFPFHVLAEIYLICYQVNPAAFQANLDNLRVPTLAKTELLRKNEHHLAQWIQEIQAPPPPKPAPLPRPDKKKSRTPSTPRPSKRSTSTPNTPGKLKDKPKRPLSAYMKFYLAVYPAVSNKLADSLTPTDNVATCSAKKCGQVNLTFSFFTSLRSCGNRSRRK